MNGHGLPGAQGGVHLDGFGRIDMGILIHQGGCVGTNGNGRQINRPWQVGTYLGKQKWKGAWPGRVARKIKTGGVVTSGTFKENGIREP